MAAQLHGVVVRVAESSDIGAIASLRALWARRYARLVLSPSARAAPFFRRAGLVTPHDAAGDDRLLVRSGRPG